MDKNELYHWGVKGMKWGVRRYQNNDGTLTAAGKKRRKTELSEDARDAARIKTKKVGEMSNAELRRLNERTRLEQEHKRLHPNAFKRGVAVVAATAGVMTTVMTAYDKSGKLFNLGKRVGDRIIDGAGDMIMKDLNKRING